MQWKNILRRKRKNNEYLHTHIHKNNSTRGRIKANDKRRLYELRFLEKLVTLDGCSIP
jgi:hypothetical protein